ncbi:MAG: hypothetical protein ABIR78_08325 [Ferruginibacter sp.]
MKRQLVSFLFSVTLLISCSHTNKLSEKDYKWMPYTGNETLVFRSNAGIGDTVFLLKKDTLLGYADPLSPFGVQYEVLSVFAKYTDPTEGEHRYFENNFFQINKGKDKLAELDIFFSAADATFYRSSKIKLDSLDKENPSMLQTQHGNYYDVYVFYGEDELGYGQRSNFITKIYWSKSNGLIRYDKKDSVYWELAKKW